MGSVLALVVVAICLALSIKNKNPEINMMISVCLCIYIIFICLDEINDIVVSIREVFGKIKVNKAYLAILFKLMSIAYMSELSSNLCKDAGYTAISTEIELLGKITMLVVSMPVLLQVVNLIMGL